jgi:hypothetical protein
MHGAVSGSGLVHDLIDDIAIVIVATGHRNAPQFKAILPFPHTVTPLIPFLYQQDEASSLSYSV